jgi:hypothetical protein
MLFYRAALPLSRKTLNYVSGIIRRHRKSIGSRWPKLNSGRQACASARSTTEGRVDLGRPGRAGGRRPGHSGRQGLPGSEAREDPVPREEQARIPEAGQPRPRETPRIRRARERPAQDVAHPAEAPLLPLARRGSSPRPSMYCRSAKLSRLERVPWSGTLNLGSQLPHQSHQCVQPCIYWSVAPNEWTRSRPVCSVRSKDDSYDNVSSNLSLVLTEKGCSTRASCGKALVMSRSENIMTCIIQ